MVIRDGFLAVHGRVEDIPDAHHDRGHQNQQAKDEPRRSASRFVRWLSDSKGVDECRSEGFEELHDFSVRKMGWAASGSLTMHRIGDL